MSITPLAALVRFPTLLAALVTGVGCTTLPSSRRFAAGCATVPLPSITAHANREQCGAIEAPLWPEHRFASLDDLAQTAIVPYPAGDRPDDFAPAAQMMSPRPMFKKLRFQMIVDSSRQARDRSPHRAGKFAGSPLHTRDSWFYSFVLVGEHPPNHWAPREVPTLMDLRYRIVVRRLELETHVKAFQFV